MKKDTTELILGEVIKINTEILKLHSEMGYIKDDNKRHHTALGELRIKIEKEFVEVNERFRKVDERFGEMNERFGEMNERFNAVDDRLDEIEMKVEWAGEKIFIDHEKRLASLEVATQP
jgi:predicted nuclease with TOPRIM domain